MINAVIMAGGSGTRLWPLSRSAYPKQFLTLNESKTMYQSTIERLSNLEISSLITICNDEHRFLVAEQLQGINQWGPIILEPTAKNTAPAVTLAALSTNEDDMLLILPADHIIQDETAFTEAINKAIPHAKNGKLITFGIVPNKPHTGYGYIKAGNKIDNGFIVDKFEEKPTSDVAQNYFVSGKYFWNSGIFLFKASSYLNELKNFRPDIHSFCFDSYKQSKKDIDFIRINKEIFDKCPSDSIDYAVMEKTKKALVIPIDAGWSDVGSWSSIWDISHKNEDNNYVNGDIMMHESKNCYVRSDNKLVAVIGADNLVVINTKDAVMVAHKEKVDDAKNIVQRLKSENRSEWELSREVYRPWGKYDSIDNGDGYQVKHITVKPGAKLSVQMHHHRAEHWIVLSGTAKVTLGKKKFLLKENESTYIPVGEIHALENPEKISLEIIEVQSGSYLGEDDIVRFEDIYGRIEN